MQRYKYFTVPGFHGETCFFFFYEILPECLKVIVFQNTSKFFCVLTPYIFSLIREVLLTFLFHFSIACRNLVSTNMGIRFRVPLQKLHPLSRAIHHRYSGNTNPQRTPHRSAARYFTSMSRLPMRPPKPPPGSGGRSYQQKRNFWVARLAARLLKLRYILLGSAVGGGYTAKKVSAA